MATAIDKPDEPEGEERDDWREQELRRRFEVRAEDRKWRERSAAAALKAEKRRILMEQYNKVKSKHDRESNRIADGIDDDRRLFTQTDQQLGVQGLMRNLNEDAERNVRRQRETVDKLDDLRKRLTRLKVTVQQGQGGAGAFADKIVDNEMREQFKGETSTLYKRCSKCNQRILMSLLDAHEPMCLGAPPEQDEEEEEEDSAAAPGSAEAEEKRKKARERAAKKKQERERYLATKKKKPVVQMEPQAPRDLYLGDAKHNSVLIKWKEPILDGGAEIYEHELSYSRVNKKLIGKKVLEETEEMPPILCTRWIFKKPVGEHGYRIVNLDGGTDYVNITVRCRNEIGWGPPSAPLERATTLSPKSPDSPGYFICKSVTATTILIEWAAPFDDGASEIVDYELSYTEMVPRDSMDAKKGSKPAGGLGSTLQEKHHKYRLGGPMESYMIIDCRGDEDYKNFNLIAINKAEYQSEPSVIPLIHTGLPSLKQRLQKELQRAKQASGTNIDTDFYMGFSQRENRADYIKRLEADLKAAIESGEEDGGDEKEAQNIAKSKRWTKLRMAKKFTSKTESTGPAEDPEAIYEQLIPGYKTRKKQFDYKIHKLEKTITEAEATRLECFASRATIARELRESWARLIEVQGEIDRVKDFTGDKISSAVMHGTDQIFDVAQLRIDLEEELSIATIKIATSKADVIRKDRLRVDMIKLKAKCEEQLKLRQAAFQKFLMDAKRANKFKENTKTRSPEELLKMCFGIWSGILQQKHRVTALMGRVWGDTARRALHHAWHKWVHGRFEGDPEHMDDYVVIGRGGQLLIDAEMRRTDNQEDFSSLLRDVYNIRKDMEYLARTNKQMTKLRDSSFWKETEYGHGLGDREDLTYMIEGDGFMRIDRGDKAAECYLKQIGVLKGQQTDLKRDHLNRIIDKEAENDIIYCLSLVYHRLARSHYSNRHWDRGIVASDRAISLADEIENSATKSDGFLALADGYYGKDAFQDAQQYYEKAMLGFKLTGNASKQAIAHRGLHVCYRAMHSLFHAEEHDKLAKAIQNEMDNRVKGGFSKLDEIKHRLIDTTAENSKTVNLERVTADCISMRKKRIQKLQNIEDIHEELAEQQKEVERVEDLLQKIKDQLVEAIDSTADEMNSSLVHGKEQVFDIEELKVRLKERTVEVGEDCEKQVKLTRAIETRIANCQEEIRVFDEELMVEEGALMRSVMGKRTLRNVALNPSNEKGNEVTGTASGGVEKLVASEGRTINVWNIHSGELECVFAGDEVGRHVGEAEGQLATISCLFFYDTRVYSGGMDMVVQVWDVVEKKRVMALEGHEASVTSIYVDNWKIMTGSADTKIHIWDKESGQMLRLLHGHAKAILSLECGHYWAVSGGAEGHVRVWEIKTADPTAKDFDPRGDKVKCTKRLKGHGCAVTAVRYGKFEVISAGWDGQIIIWWLKTGEILQRCKSHVGMIKQLQFDATRIVSAGIDNNVVVTDITSGEPIQSLRGHTGQVLALAFDLEKIISVAADNTLRHWAWGDGANTKTDKHHVWEQGDTLPKVAKLYELSLPNLIKWNDLKANAKMYAGRRLIVAKGDPGKLSEAEVEALERKKKEAQRQRKSNQKYKEVQMDESKLFRVDNRTIAEQQKVNIFEPERIQALASYGYDTYDDDATYSSRMVAAMPYDTQGPHMLEEDMRFETRRSGRAFENKKRLGHRLGEYVKKMRDEEEPEEADEVSRAEFMMTYRTPEAWLAEEIFEFLVVAHVDEECRLAAVECTRTEMWPETLGARLIFGQEYQSQKIATDEAEQKKLDEEQRERNIALLKGLKDSGHLQGNMLESPSKDARRGRRLGANVADMRRRQSLWKGGSVVDPGSEGGEQDAYFSRRGQANKPQSTLAAAGQRALGLDDGNSIGLDSGDSNSLESGLRTISDSDSKLSIGTNLSSPVDSLANEMMLQGADPEQRSLAGIGSVASLSLNQSILEEGSDEESEDDG